MLDESWLEQREADAETACARTAERARIDRALRGEPRAVREIVEQHRPGMYALALRVVRDPSEAEDLVQESFARAFRRLDRFDPTYRLSTWLYRIVLNSCRDHLRSPRRKERPTSVWCEPARAPHELTEDPMLACERAQRVRRAIAQLRPNYREIIVLKDLMELSYEEIREITGSSITGLKIRAIRARTRLRKLLEEELA